MTLAPAAPTVSMTTTADAPQREHEALLRIENLVVEYHLDGKIVHAVSDLSFEISRARRSVSSASPGAGNPRSAARYCS